jgi:hypothetical protein
VSENQGSARATTLTSTHSSGVDVYQMLIQDTATVVVVPRRKQVYKITYPNGKMIYVGMERRRPN